MLHSHFEHVGPAEIPAGPVKSQALRLVGEWTISLWFRHAWSEPQSLPCSLTAIFIDKMKRGIRDHRRKVVMRKSEQIGMQSRARQWNSNPYCFQVAVQIRRLFRCIYATMQLRNRWYCLFRWQRSMAPSELSSLEFRKKRVQQVRRCYREPLLAAHDVACDPPLLERWTVHSWLWPPTEAYAGASK